MFFGLISVSLIASASALSELQPEFENVTRQLSEMSKTPLYTTLLRSAQWSVQQETAVGLHRRGRLRHLQSPVAGSLYKTYTARANVPFTELYDKYVAAPCEQVLRLDAKLVELAEDKRVITLRFRQDSESAVLRKLIEICHEQRRQGAKQQVYQDFLRM